MNTVNMMSLALGLGLGLGMLTAGMQLGQRQLARALAALVAKGAVRLSNSDGQSLNVEGLMRQLHGQQEQASQAPADLRKLFTMVGVGLLGAVVSSYLLNLFWQ